MSQIFVSSLALVLTIAVLSRVIGPNPLFRAAQYLFVGTSLGLGFVIAYHQVLLPAARSLLPESAWNPLDSVPPGGHGLPRPLEEARQLMIKAVKREAPVAGAITLLKLKMARSREDLVGLLDDVEQRVGRSRQPIIAAQTMRHVRHLLTLVESTVSVPGA